MYKSPIEVFQEEMQYHFDNNIVEAVQRYDIQVDKDELLKALRYDREQYEKGYADGKRDAMDKLVRCKDCIYWQETCKDPIFNLVWGQCKCPESPYRYEEDVSSNDFCSYAYRREEK